jgi:hypothetical protein
MTTYRIARFGQDDLVVEIHGIPPCLYCGAPVTEPSMDGPLVCAPCDMGRNADGTRWTDEQDRERHRHFADAIDKLVAANVDRNPWATSTACVDGDEPPVDVEHVRRVVAELAEARCKEQGCELLGGHAGLHYAVVNGGYAEWGASDIVTGDGTTFRIGESNGAFKPHDGTPDPAAKEAADMLGCDFMGRMSKRPS